VGIDASQMSVEVARRHAATSALNIEYRHELSSTTASKGEQFDVVINAEVVEHVPDQSALIKECCDLVNPGGFLVLATLNRTIKSWIIAIFGAEYVMRYLPKGTHDWKMFVTPNELNQMASTNGVTQIAESGMKYNPLKAEWRLSNDTSVNYIQCYKK
jgi:2-polyprenyl-6-hydroxyphenyl methylase/3-demethylubiquinone-9 3-methyltransferase